MLKLLKNILLDLKNQIFVKKTEEQIHLTGGEELAQSVLDFFAESLHITIVPSKILESFRSLRNKFAGLGQKNFTDFLFAVSYQYQIRINVVRKSLEQIKPYITQESPFVFEIANEGEKFPKYFGILSSHLSSYLVRPLNEWEGEEVWYSEKELLKLMGIKSNKELFDWIIAEPIFAYSIKKEDYSTESPLKAALHQISHLMRMESKDIWIVLIYGLGIGILSLVVPVATSSLVNIVAFGVLLQPVIILTLLVVFFLGFAGTMQVIQAYVVEILQRRVFVRVATEFATKIPKIKQEALDNFHKPELVNRFFDTMTIQKSIHSLLVDGLAVVLTTIIGFLLISFYHPLFIVFAFIIIFIGGYFVIYKLGRPAGESYIKISKEKYKVAAWLEEIARHTALFHSTFGSQFGLEKADSLLRDYLFARKKYFSVYIKQIIGLIGIQSIASAVVLGLGGYLVIKRQLTIGQLVAAELVIAKVLSDISKFGKQLDSFYALIAAVDKINSVFYLPTNPSRPLIFESTGLPIKVQLTDVSYSLPNNDKIFSKFNLKILSGKSTGISSNTPYDAQVLLDLISGIREPQSGIVEYDNQNIREVSNHQIQSVSYLIRGNEIFEGSILENLRVGREEISHIEIRELLEDLGFWQTIQSLPKGIHTHLLTFGYPIDSIQTNMITIARALLGKPRLLLVDGNLDTLPNHLLQSCLKVLLKKQNPWTLVVVTKSQTVLSQMDQILKLEDDSYSLKANK
ncbi:ABC transporter ATP-binding protein [Leptospira sp. 96542]|nr:ABC transporter ATP-binding protein [Leptospira sp. 96542]